MTTHYFAVGKPLNKRHKITKIGPFMTRSAASFVRDLREEREGAQHQRGVKVKLHQWSVSYRKAA